MPREVPRARRVAEQVQRILSEMLRRDVRDPRFKPLTITHVRLSSDLAHAWVYYAPLSGDSHDPLQREILDEAVALFTAAGSRAVRVLGEAEGTVYVEGVRPRS